jgi:hypothetical protein
MLHFGKLLIRKVLSERGVLTRDRFDSQRVRKFGNRKQAGILAHRFLSSKEAERIWASTSDDTTSGDTCEDGEKRRGIYSMRRKLPLGFVRGAARLTRVQKLTYTFPCRMPFSFGRHGCVLVTQYICDFSIGLARLVQVLGLFC